MIFTVHAADTGSEALETAKLVPEATAPWAIIAPPFWLIVHRLWFGLLVYLLVTAILLVSLLTALGPFAFVLASLPGLYLLLEGNNLRRAKLERRGFPMISVVEAANRRDAEELLIARHVNNYQSGPVNYAEAPAQPKKSKNKVTSEDRRVAVDPWNNEPLSLGLVDDRI
ncbi:MAG: DUF2628 domain-containing protein [Pseudomonadota bacterium]